MGSVKAQGLMLCASKPSRVGPAVWAIKTRTPGLRGGGFLKPTTQEA